MKAHVLPELSHSLISIGKLCDAGCTATFDANKVIIHHRNQPVLTGPRNSNGLWSLYPKRQTPPMQATPIHTANLTIHDAVTKDIIKFLHLSLYSPTKSTLLKAIQNNHFVGWPGLTQQNVKRYLQLEEPTIMGHMDQQRQGTRSTTRTRVTNETVTQDQPTIGHNEDTPTRTHMAYISIQDLPTGRVYTDQTGAFPVVSSQGIKAVMIMYDFDSNAILTEGITSRGKIELRRAYTCLFQRLQHAGAKPKIHRMDNEVSDVVKTFLQQQQVQLELTPAHIHRRNAAERAIRTWKNHFLAGLASLNPRFPLRYWSYLLPQAELTLNLLRQSRLNPRLSAYAQLFGIFDYNRTPIAPPGCELIAFHPPGLRPSWGFHGYKAWYTRPALQHYRCVHAITATTGRESTIETMQFLPHSFRPPTLTPTQLVTVAATDLTKALTTLTNAGPANHLDQLTASQAQRLTALADIFASMAPQTNEPSTALPRVEPTESRTPSATPGPNPPPTPRVTEDNPQAGHMQQAQTSDISDVTLTVLPTSADAGHIGHHFANAVYDPESGRQLEYRHLIRHPTLKHIWLRSGANEFGRLAQGIRDIPGTDTITFVPKSEIPKNKRPTYARFVTDIRPQKQEKHRVRLTIGGNLIEYEGDVSSPTGSLTTYKIHCNDIISTPHARAMSLDIENYYLNTPLPTPEYMKVHISLIPDEIIQAYNLWSIVDSEGYIHIRLNKGMYGLPQAGILAYQLLVKRLAPHGYAPVRHTPGLWKHNKTGTTFVLVVDDFSVKYLNRQDAEDFLTLLRTWYTIKVDWEAKLYCGITTEWDYRNRRVTLSMPGYVETFLREINHPHPTRPQSASPIPTHPIRKRSTTRACTGHQ
jgi:Reverse transcriptase (RNA-dependent DNA polymerase)